MDDQQLWRFGDVRLKAVLADLSPEARVVLTYLLSGYRKAKESLAAVVADVDAASVCGECGGQRCQNGKYRMSVFDALARTRAKTPASAVFPRNRSARMALKPVAAWNLDYGLLTSFCSFVTKLAGSCHRRRLRC